MALATVPVIGTIAFLMGMVNAVDAPARQALVQGMVKQEFHGRVMSIYVLMFLGMAPIGNFEIGYLTEHFGIARAFEINAGIILLFGAFIFYYRKRIKVSYRAYKIKNGQRE